MSGSNFYETDVRYIIIKQSSQEHLNNFNKILANLIPDNSMYVINLFNIQVISENEFGNQFLSLLRFFKVTLNDFVLISEILLWKFLENGFSACFFLDSFIHSIW